MQPPSQGKSPGNEVQNVVSIFKKFPRKGIVKWKNFTLTGMILNFAIHRAFVSQNQLIGN